MNFKLILSALQARYRLFFLILLITVSTTLVVSLAMPKTYVAQVSLLLDGKDEQSMRSTNAPLDRERAGYMQTQVDILTSPKVARRVIADLNLATNPDVIESFESSGAIGALENWLAEGLAKQIKVETSQSSLVQLSFASSDPEYSAKVANAYAKAYVDTVLELRVEPTRQTSIWFDEQLKGLRDNMAQAEQRLTDFQQEHGIVAKEEHLDIDNIQLTSLAGQLASPGNGFAADRQSGPDSNVVVQRLKTDLLRSESKLQEASVNFGSKHPQYQRQMAEVLGLRQQVAEETGNAIAVAASAAERSRQSRNRLLGEIAAQRDRVLGLKQARNQLVMLNHDVDIAQRTYDTAMQRFMASKIESRALQTNVSVLDQALAPSIPARPKIGLNIALSLFIGTLLGLAIVSLIELLDQRVRLLDDLSEDLQVPLLAVLSNETPTNGWLPALPAPRHALPAPG
ncbi:MAG: GNVR domain-containing protein [Rhodocyclaceae bacterium]|nr:GNVR domain-containing protein [Rhodocyclaceae bacterium]MDZ4213982.1 GNVR domain-containing protein [Rhodocyclaceae bacterium]